MKKLIGILSLAITTFIATPEAEARGRDRGYSRDHDRHHHHHSHYKPRRHYVKYHSHCHGPAYVETYVAYYRYGRPVFRTRVIPVRHHHHHSRPSGGVSFHFSGRL